MSRGQPRSRPAPTIGMRAVVRYVPLPADRLDAFNKQVGKMLDRGIQAMAADGRKAGAA